MYSIRPQSDTLGQTANFLPGSYDPSQAMRLYFPAFDSTGKKVAIDKATGRRWTPQRRPSGAELGNLLNGVFQSGKGIEAGLYENRGCSTRASGSPTI